MKTATFEVLSPDEVERIHVASMEILAEVGIKVGYKKAREIFREAGARVDEETQIVRLSEKLVRWAVEQAPKQFSLFGIDAQFRLDIGAESGVARFRRVGNADAHRRPQGSYDPPHYQAGHDRPYHPDRCLPAHP